MKRYILLAALLAVVCVGGVELWACSFQAPEVYSAITAPVRAAAGRLGELGQRAWTGLNELGQQAWESVTLAAAESSARLQAAVRQFQESMEPRLPEEDAQLVSSETGTVKPPPKPQAAYSVTKLTILDGQEYLTGGALEVVYYNQTDDAWAGRPYGSDHIGGYGCGPSAMSIVVSTLTGSKVDPASMAQHCVDHGYWARKQGSYLSVVPGAAEDFGLRCASLSQEELDLDTITQHFASGSLIVALMGPGHFTNGGHFVVLRGVALDGSILVADPASRDRSLTTWDLELILDELSSNRSSGGPLWIVSRIDPF